MELTDEDIREFIAAWKEDFGESLTPKRAREEATAIMELSLLLAQPLAPEEEREPNLSP